MTREEQIRNAKNAFYERIFEEGYYYDPRDCFEEGAEWADEHPKNPWISVSDKLPFECEETRLTDSVTKIVLTHNCAHQKIVAYMTIINGIWSWRDIEGNPIVTVTDWMPIPNIND